jgi:hypothetical protein
MGRGIAVKHLFGVHRGGAEIKVLFVKGRVEDHIVLCVMVTEGVKPQAPRRSQDAGRFKGIQVHCPGLD